MRKYFVLLVMAVATATSAMGDDKGQDSCKGDDCRQKTRDVCFNVYCQYQADKDVAGVRGAYRDCEAAARFTKKVYDDGSEVLDRSKKGDSPDLQVACDGQILVKGPGNRFTDWMGTRIQPQWGPFPAILLPKDALRDTHRYYVSTVEFERQILKGLCYVYTDPQGVPELPTLQ